MLRRNLIAIAIAVLGLGITSAFGQPTSVRKGTIKKPTSFSDREVGSGMATGVKARRTSGSSSRTRKPTSANSVFTNDTIDKLEVRRKSNTSRSRNSSRTRKSARGLTYQKIETVKKPSNWSFGESYPPGAKSKQPRRRSTQKRQHKP